MKLFQIFFVFLILFSRILLAVPQMPSDPSSENSFKVIKSFYDIESKLPNYKVDSIVVKTEANFNLQIVCLKLEKDKASVEPIAMLAISLPAFLRLHEQLNGAVAKMVEQGVLKKNDPSVTTVPQENIKFGN